MVSGVPAIDRPNLVAAAQAYAPNRQDDGITLEQILATFRRRIWLIVAVAVAGACLAALIGLYVTPRYTATTSLLVEPKQAGLLDAISLERERAPDPTFMQTQIQLLTSRSHLSGIVNELSLFDDPELRPEIVEDDSTLIIKLPGVLAAVASLLPDTWLIAIGLAEEGITRTEMETPTALAEAVIDRFMWNIEAWQAGESYIIDVGYTSVDPQKAAWLAKAVANSYVKWQFEGKRGGLGLAASWLESRLTALQAIVRTSEQKVAEFRATHGMAASTSLTFSDQSIADLYEQLIEIRGEQIALRAKLDRITSASRDPGEEGAASTLAEELNSSVIADLRAQETTLLREQAQLTETYGSLHPKMANMRVALAEIESKIRNEIDRGIRSLRDELVVLSGRERTINEEMEKLRRESQTDRLAEVQLAELEREAQANRDLYTTALTQYQAAQQQGQAIMPDVRVISQAVPPEEPSNPSPIVFAMIGGVSSLMLGAFLSLLVERLDRRVRSIDDLERLLGVRVLGIMPRLSKRFAQKPDLYVSNNPLSAFSECAQSILATLDMTEKDGAACPVLLVTSALPGEGKTTLLISLAAAIARTQARVLVIDLDLRRPAVDRRLIGRSSRVGLVDYLNGDLPREQLIHRQSRSGIDYIPAGTLPDNPVQLLRSPELHQLIHSARSEYDHILLDCSPILAVTDAKVATRLADRVVLAARWNETDVAAVGYAIRLLDEVGARLLGCVLSVVEMRKYNLYGNDWGKYHSRYKDYYLMGNSNKRAAGLKQWWFGKQNSTGKS